MNIIILVSLKILKRMEREDNMIIMDSFYMKEILAFFIEITRDKEYNILINYVFVVFCDFLKILMKLKGNY